MPRHMSVALTEDAVRARRKTVTRRIGWQFLRPGEHLHLVRKSMGRRRPDGSLEPLVIVATVEVVSVRRERLCDITDDDVTAEGVDRALWDIDHGYGFDRPARWAAWFAEQMRCDLTTEVTRIEFRYLESVPK